MSICPCSQRRIRHLRPCNLQGPRAFYRERPTRCVQHMNIQFHATCWASGRFCNRLLCAIIHEKVACMLPHHPQHNWIQEFRRAAFVSRGHVHNAVQRVDQPSVVETDVERPVLDKGPKCWRLCQSTHAMDAHPTNHVFVENHQNVIFQGNTILKMGLKLGKRPKSGILGTLASAATRDI